ncbi:MAG: terpene cyclase/mutase family protein [Planctomycetota bacterium]|jgi:hypothetical protein|nr:terpene cyclase/mutase family protein [Planctomycetota bacterium]
MIRVAILVLVMSLGTVSAAEAPAVDNAALDAGIARGLAALAKLQEPDGSVGQGAGITALAGMAFLAGGHTPTAGAYSDNSAACLRFVLATQDPLTGYLGGDFGNMYAHGFATLYLAEVYGMAGEPRVRRSLEAALDLIFRSQNSEGGWRYQPIPVDADISATICQVMAIRAANNIGIGGEAANQAIGRAVQYVRRCANPDGSFTYMAGGGQFGTEGPQGVPRAAAGSMCLIGAGIYDTTNDTVLGPALNFLRSNVEAHLRGGGHWYWYGQYYASQAMFHSPRQEDWQRYWKLASAIILGHQDSGGYWSTPDSYGPAYGTAMALIILQIPNNYLPIFQR